jgi:Fungal specific transcription factor domain
MSSSVMSPDQKQEMPSWGAAPRRQSYGSATANGQTPYQVADPRYSTGSSAVPPSPVRGYSNPSASTAQNWAGIRTDSDGNIPRASATNGYATMSTTLAPSYLSNDYQQTSGSRPSDAAFAAAVSQGIQASRTDPYPYNSINAMSGVDINAAYNYPIFASEEYQTPFAIPDDFTAWLFNDAHSGSADFSPTNFMTTYNEIPTAQVQGPYFSQSPTSSGSVRTSVPQHPMSVTSILDNTERSQYIMSEEKRSELLTLMQHQFVERPHDAVKKRKDSVFEGDVDSEGHILSLRMMHTYIGSYWYHQHAQLPILHKPTFSADKTPNLLLLAVIAIGAATLDKAYGTSLTDSAAEFANFVIWHLRWEIVRDSDFRPPAKLWVFQALLLIETYEKMYATRALHERAHIHHDSTLTLMRRGSSLLGRSAADTPPSLRGEIKDAASSVNGSAEQSKSEESWHRWIQTEATRRAAFGAFVLDSIHSTMFGHAAKMVAHEMRLPLPCDEGLWSAVSPAEASRVQSSLQNNGVKPTMFLDGLKKTLTGQRVRTNSFGRTIIMAGLLSVSWHMTQRDIQISSLGQRTATSFGGLDKWKSVLLRAFDNWKRDFDEALAESAPTPLSPTLRAHTAPGVPSLRPVDDENIFESRTVLHHLAHIAAHVDVVDCQVFAGANRLLGRSVTPKDYSLVREKIERWATKASARDAAFYALKFIAQIIKPPSGEGDLDGRHYGHASPILPQAFEQNQYIARDDFLLNRPWVLYISALVVWCYGFALEGPINPLPRAEEFDTYAKKERDMMSYLDRVAGVRAPDDLEGVQGKNRCLGLLMILKDSFGSTRWELTHEAAGLLGNACLKLKGVEEGEDAEGNWVGELGGKEGWDAAVREGRPGEMTVANAARV